MPRPITGKPVGRPRKLPAAPARSSAQAQRSPAANNLDPDAIRAMWDAPSIPEGPHERPSSIPAHLVRMVSHTVTSISGPGITSHPSESGVVFVDFESIPRLEAHGFRVEH